MDDTLTRNVTSHLDALCAYPDRRVGGPGNRAATAYFADVCREHGWDVAVEGFDAVDCESGDVTLSAGEMTFEAHVSLYSLPYSGSAVLAAASTIDELEAGDFAGKLLLLHGDVAREQLMAKGFVFFNPEGHQRIYAALEAQQPAAIIAATGHNPGLTASLYPFPMFEDADFDIPSVYMKDTEGERLVAHVGEQVSLHFESRRIPVRGEHVVARKAGTGAGRVVLFGHIDSRDGTPGALDNATGTAALLALAELMRDYAGPLSVELAPLNGEDYYAASGHMIWMAENEDRFDDIVLGFNADGAGFVGEATAVSFYGLTDALEATVAAVMDRFPAFEPGDPWPQSDHSLFIQNGRPAIAVTCANFGYLASEIAHTEKDTLDLVDPAVVADIGRFYREVIDRLVG